MQTLKRRAEFLAVRGGPRASTPAFIVEAKRRTSGTVPTSAARFGFTVTKKLGNAVIRNKIRRRLREAIRTGALTAAQDGVDYVVIARPPALELPFAELARRLKDAFESLARRLPPTRP